MNLLLRGARKVYRTGLHGYRLARALPLAHRVLTKYSPPRNMLGFGGGLGDDLLLTSVLREMKKRTASHIALITRYPEMFLGNSDPDDIVGFSENLFTLARIGLVNVRIPWYTFRDPADEQKDRDLVPEDHIIALMCSHAGVEGDVLLRPYWHFLPLEREFGKFARVQVAIHSTGLSKDAKMPLKEWYPARFQEVIDRLSPAVTFVQVGRSADVPLHNVVDLRGKTNVRETAAVLANSACFVGLVGFLMHLARAVDCRSVIVYGGREAPTQSGYAANLNLYSPETCAPCWRWERCDFERICMDRIESPEVISAVTRVLDEHLAELPTTSRNIVSRESLVSSDTQLQRLEFSVRKQYQSFPPGSR